MEREVTSCVPGKRNLATRESDDNTFLAIVVALIGPRRRRRAFPPLRCSERRDFPRLRCSQATKAGKAPSWGGGGGVTLRFGGGGGGGDLAFDIGDCR